VEEEFYIAESDLTTSMKAIRFYFHRVSPFTPRLATKLFWHLFTQPRPRKFSKQDESFYDRAEQELCASNIYGKKYLLNKRGSGTKKIVVLHGWEGRASDFNKLISQLEKEATVYAVDFPGHGKAPKSRAHLPMFMDVIQSAIEHVGDVDMIIGHSLGAASLAMTVGKNDFSNQVNKVVFLGLHPVPSQYFVQYKKVTRVSDRVFQRCVRLAESKTGAKLLEYDCYNYLPQYHKYSIHFIHDELDKIIKVDRVEQLSEQIGDSAVFKGDHGGHFRHYKDQEVISEIIRILMD
jgi:pimeloyl-ACP methyl ester carboxylesterase